MIAAVLLLVPVAAGMAAFWADSVRQDARTREAS